MNSDLPSGLRPELLDDFYAECDELLSAIRTGLSQLEAAGKKEPDSGVLEGLMRSMHSLKGVSAIAGAGTSERLAHALEDLLRALLKRAIPFGDEVAGLLFEGAQRLEQVVAAHREGKPLPRVDEILSELRELTPGVAPIAQKIEVEAPAPATSPASRVATAIELARSKGLSAYRVLFSPSAERDRRGVNINSVRERLKGAGELLDVSPILGQGSIVFQFVVGMRAEPENLPEWESDGVVFELVEKVGAKAPVAAPVEEAVPESVSLMPSHMLRVDLARLDELLRITGELVIQRSRLDDCINREARDSIGFKEINMSFARSLREMREAVSRVRMVPIVEIFSRMPFVVRDLSRKSDKRAEVVVEDNHTEIDKYLVERLKEPLLHLVRNSFAHGIEVPAERTAAGKPDVAKITLRARSSGDSLVIEIHDDGRGIDAETIATRAQSLGIRVPGELDTAGILKVICMPGFSTRDTADLSAGRGVGMSVVANTVREVGGTLALETKPGLETRFILRLPLTLSIADAILVSAGEQSCAVPQAAVDEIIQIPAGEARFIKQSRVIPYRGGLLPFVTLNSIFRRPAGDSAILTILVLRSEAGLSGLAVDRVLGQREIVIRALSDPLVQVPEFSGSTELGDGRPILILDPAAVVRGVVRPPDDLAGNEALYSGEKAS